MVEIRQGTMGMSIVQTSFSVLLGQAIRDRLSKMGSSPRKFSLENGRSDGWLGDKINPRRPSNLTLRDLELVTDYFGTTPEKFLSDLIPGEYYQGHPKTLLHAVKVTREGQGGPSISEKYRDNLDHLLEKPLRIGRLKPAIDTSLINELINRVWEDRSDAFQYALFHAEELLERPRYLYTLIPALAVVSDLIRTLRTTETDYRLRLLLHCYHLLEAHPNQAAEAFVNEKAAYLLWDIYTSDPITRNILERPSLASHPIPSRLFAARANFQHVAGNYNLARAQLKIAETLTQDPILYACIKPLEASILIEEGRLAEAQKILEKVLEDESLPVDLRCNINAILGRFHLKNGNLVEATELLLQSLAPSYCERWPDKAAYAAIDLTEMNTNPSLLAKIRPGLNILQEALLPDHPVEGELLAEVQNMIAAASAHSTSALRRKNTDPNG